LPLCEKNRTEEESKEVIYNKGNNNKTVPFSRWRMRMSSSFSRPRLKSGAQLLLMSTLSLIFIFSHGIT